MRILHVVTLVSPDEAYGGPVSVALNQSAELRRRGHDVTVTAATRGYQMVPAERNGVPLRLFATRKPIPALKFAGMRAPTMTRWFHAVGDEFDIVHVHFTRDLVVLPMALAARRRHIPYVLQTHGMVVPSRHPLAAPVDCMCTRRALRDAGAVFYLTPRECHELNAVAGGGLRLTPLANGVPDYAAAANPTGPPEVLFAARLHDRKRPLVFVEMAKRTLAAGIDARFTLIGPDEGAGPTVLAAIGTEPRISWLGPLPHPELIERMARATACVLPSIRDPYPMSVLEAMAVGVPVVIADDCGLAPVVRRNRCGIVAGPAPEAMADALTELLTAPDLAAGMGRRGRAVAQSEMGMGPVGDRLVATYSALVEGEP